MNEIKRIPKEEAEKARQSRDFERFKAEMRHENILLQASCSIGSLKELITDINDRKTAKQLYTDLMGLAHTLSREYDFSLNK